MEKEKRQNRRTKRKKTLTFFSLFFKENSLFIFTKIDSCSLLIFYNSIKFILENTPFQKIIADSLLKNEQIQDPSMKSSQS